MLLHNSLTGNGGQGKKVVTTPKNFVDNDDMQDGDEIVASPNPYGERTSADDDDGDYDE